MKRFEAQQTYLVFMLILSVFIIILPGCGGGGGGGHWNEPTDTTAPRVTLTVPLNAATGVAINRNITATFSEDMDGATVRALGTFTVTVTGGASVAGTVTYVGRIATFDPTSNLATDTPYTAKITIAAKDLAGNPLAAEYTWSFRTALTLDVTAPTLISTGVLDGATGVPINRNSTAIFSEAMDPATLISPATNFTVVKTSDGSSVAGVVTYIGTTATFNPNSDLLPNTQYTSRITTGATDLAGNALVSGTRANPWSWTTAATGDTTAPTVTLVNPADAATGVCINKTISATFSEDLDPDTITTVTFTLAPTATLGALVTGVVIYDPLTDIATFDPNSDLLPNTQYTSTITTGVKDLADNALAVNKVWAFTTGTTTCTVPVDLNRATPFGSMGDVTGATNTGTSTVIHGDFSSTATVTSAVTGFHDSALPVPDIYTQTGDNIGLVNGLIYTCTVSTTGPTSGGVNAASCTIATNALADAQTAYNTLRDLSGGIDPSGAGGELGTLTLAPGIYKRATSFKIETGNLTLDGGGDANAVWVFQMGTTLTVGDTVNPRSIILINGAKAKNVFWQVGSSATINGIIGGGTIEGTILAAVKVTVSTVGVASVTTINGRAMGLTAQTVINNTVINVPDWP